MQPLKMPARIEARQDLLGLTGLQMLDERMGLSHQQHHHEKEGNHQQEGDADEHYDGRERRAIVEADPQTVEQSKGQRHEDRSDEDRRQKRPDDTKRRPQNEQRNEAEKNDAGETPLAAAWRAVAIVDHLQNHHAQTRRLYHRLGARGDAELSQQSIEVELD